jgi:tRNA nucleotidyltransferase/poly(A) polymerase
MIMKKDFTFYEVGGRVRDEILGLESKDIDYVAVPTEELLKDISSAHTMFGILESYLRSEGFDIFLVTSDCFTIRAKFPAGHKHQGVADFVMARKEVGYIPGTRTPMVVPGTLFDDLQRRDFTLNALAKDEDGNIIDFFEGLADLEAGILVTPLDPSQTMVDDPLRILRSWRFSITKGFKINESILESFKNPIILSRLEESVSNERIREELYKMFKHDTIESIKLLCEMEKYIPGLLSIIFKNGLHLEPSFKK